VTGGENVDPLEVERALESLPGISAACVFGVAHEDWGQEVVAALISESEELDPQAIAEHLATRLASYKRPKRFALVSSLPLNRSGKPDRARARELYETILASP
jgi:acyl-CoA synthetase (AMP-forming)/AMP-acid ligase II